MEIKIRSIYRVLGIILCLAMIVCTPFILSSDDSFDLQQKIYYLICAAFFIPIVLSSCVSGKVPDFITRFLDEESIDDLSHAEKFFTEFNAKSIGFMVVFLSMVAYSIYINM